MTKLVTIIMLLLSTSITVAQTIEKFSVDSGGASAVVSELQVLYSIGEVNIQELYLESTTISMGFITSPIPPSSVTNTIEEDEGISIYPNPVSDLLYIKSNSLLKKAQLFDALGRLVLTTNQNIIDVKNLFSGVYIVKIMMADKLIKKKIIIQ
ncbi:T9SS type A sorting domain-containing protein [Aquimarina sp. AU119]|uniref:T9SS type A sorting domain-containing protein n=1 Tax=Aquimarina sp. AU119 TaxID=2108528 RepID=UPI000D69E025|nr:T9SS type A sorting domain-containing protein [Aquimarina sp. AU119]